VTMVEVIGRQTGGLAGDGKAVDDKEATDPG
jgi:hypothetical protein